MNLSFLLLLIAVTVSSVVGWTVFPLSGKLKEASTKYSGSSPVVTSTTTSTASPSHFPAPAPQAISSFNKPSGIATPSKDLLPPKEDNRITSPDKPSLFSTSRIEPTHQAKVSTSITTKQPTFFSRTTTTYQPLASTKPVKRTIVELLTPKSIMNAVSKSQIEPITTITNEEDSETINNKSIMETKESTTILTPVDTTIAKDDASVSSTEVESITVKDINSDENIGNISPVTDTATQAIVSTTLEPITITPAFTTASTSSSTQNIQSSTPVSVGISTGDESATKLLTRFNVEIENSSTESTASDVTSTSPSPSVSSSESETLFTTIASNVEQSTKDVTKNTEGHSTQTSLSSTPASPSSVSTVSSSSSSESAVATASLARNVLLETVEQPAIELLPPKEPIGGGQVYSFFPFKPIYVELEPPKEEYTSVYYPSVA